MIAPSLRSKLEPMVANYRRCILWQRLTLAWAALGMAGLAVLGLSTWTGWSSKLLFPLFLAAAIVTFLVVWARTRSRKIDFHAIAQKVEQENPKLNSLLLAAIEQHPDKETGEFGYLQERVISEALEYNKSHPWDHKLVDRLFTIQSVHILALVSFLLVLSGLSRTKPNNSPGASFVFGVTVSPGDTNIERGSSLLVLARFPRPLPSDATLVIESPNQPPERVPLQKSLSDPVFGGNVFDVKNDFRYHVEYGEKRTPDFKVGVFQYPLLERADASLTYPAFTGLPPRQYDDTRRVSAVTGTVLDYRFVLNKPVQSARLVSRDNKAIPLQPVEGLSNVYTTRMVLDQPGKYDLLLADAAGRTNRMPPQFVIDVHENKAPQLKMTFPRGDQRVSSLEEVSFEGEVWDDFGVTSYGFAYSLVDQEPQFIKLGESVPGRQKQAFSHMLSLEQLGVRPEDLVSYFVWAEDIGNDGQIRRTSSDMWFAEIRPFDETFKEAQQSGGNSNNQQQEGGETEKLAELQKQILTATWNLQRRETDAKVSSNFKKDAQIIQRSQEQALTQLKELKSKAEDAKSRAIADRAEKDMEKALTQLAESIAGNSTKPLPTAIGAEQSAYRNVLRLEPKDYNVSQSRGGSGSSRGGQRSQRQLDQLEMRQAQSRYETQRTASGQNTEQREQLQVLNQLKELARRQEDINERLKELQTALNEARSRQEKDELQRQLKRLQDEQRQLLEDLDGVRQRVARPDSPQMAEALQNLDQTRSDVREAAEQLEKGSVSQALASGTRAQRQLQEAKEEFRKQTSSQFAEDMQRMRSTARELAEKQEELSKQIDSLAESKQKSLSDTQQRQQIAQALEQQKSGITNLMDNVRQITEQAEASEPLLSEKLYDLYRHTDQAGMQNNLDQAAMRISRGFVQDSREFEAVARSGIDQLRRKVEQAAESILGDETEALKLARNELEDLTRQLEQETNRNSGSQDNRSSAQARAGSDATEQQRQGQGGRSNQPSDEENNRGSRQAASRQPGDQSQRAQAQGPGNGGGENEPRSQTEQARNGGSPGQAGQQNRDRNRETAGQSQQGSGGQQGEQGRNGGNGGNGGGRDANQERLAQNDRSQQGGNRGSGGGRGGGGRANFLNQGIGTDTGGEEGPITGENYAQWAERLRDVEDMLDIPELRNEITRVRDRTRAMRSDYKRHSREPHWGMVQADIIQPLIEIRSRISEELARRASREALVPIDRDPVPQKYSELVRRYYEKLGSEQ